jgi:hypothetical protein
MVSIRLIVALCSVLSIQIIIVSAACLERTCTHMYGARYAFITAKATLIDTQVTPTIGFDPIPCCDLCLKTNGCFVYDLEFSTNVCQVYSLPSYLIDNGSTGYTQFIRAGNETRCIGFSNKNLKLQQNNDMK